MLLKLDENRPPSAAELLRSFSHDVMTVIDLGPEVREVAFE